MQRQSSVGNCLSMVGYPFIDGIFCRWWDIHGTHCHWWDILSLVGYPVVDGISCHWSDILSLVRYPVVGGISSCRVLLAGN